jgi:hypothetical protein
MKRLSLFIMLSAAVLLTACKGIDNVGPDVETVAAKQKTSTIIRDVNVSQNEAIEIANRFVRSNDDSGMLPTKSAFSSTKMIRSTETVSEDGQNLMYVFNYQGGGFVIVGSTRNYYPILAYSDEGSFVLQDDMGPVDVWLDETKVSIKNSNSLDNDTKSQMQNLWARYDGTFVDPAQELLSVRRPQTRSTGEDACWDRIDSLQAEHGIDGWTYLPLAFVEDIFTNLNLHSYYDDICYSAFQNNSALNETVIGYRTPAVVQVGPLLATKWHQYSPFNDLCPYPSPAGCGVIAAAQVIRYHEEPDTLTWNGVALPWIDIPISPDTIPNKIPQFIRRLGQAFGAEYGYWETSTSLLNIFQGLRSLGYWIDYDEDNIEAGYRDAVFYDHNPVIMYGWDSNASDAGGFAWVCDGVRQAWYYAIQFYTENQPYGTGEFTQGMYSYDNPGQLGNLYGTPSYTYHMNWGLTNTSYNGWYTSNQTFGEPINYNYKRKNMVPYLL